MRLKPIFQLSSQNLILAASVYFGLVLNCSFWRYVYTHLPLTGFANIWLALVLPVLVCIPFYLIFSLILLPKTAKPVLFFLLPVSSITNYLMFKLGVFIDADMIRNAVETNTREALDLVTFSGFLWVLFTGLLPVIVLLYTRIGFGSFKQELKARFLGILLSFFVFGLIGATSYKEIAAVGRNNKSARKLLNTINYTYGTVRYVQKQIQSRRPFVTLDEQAALTPYEDPYKTVLILVIGETARAANFSLQGYAKKTNPLLEKQDIVYFKEMSSCGTATAISVPCLFSHLVRTDFDADDAKNTENLLDLLQKSGYDILWRENDDGCKGVCNRVKTEEMVKTNNPKYCNGTSCYDEVLLDGLEDILKNIKQDTVIVLHTMGSHGPTYYNRYPERFKVFQPTCDTADIQNCSTEQIVNTYDNTIVYTDFIVSSVIDLLKKFPEYESGMIYVSDHGESLGENNIYLHGFPYKLAPKEQIEIPMVVWMSENMKQYDHVDYACVKNEAATKSYAHDHLFHSILGLLEIDTTEYDVKYDMFNPCRIKRLPFMERTK